MKIKNIFSPYDSSSFSLYRIVFYLAVFVFFTQFSGLVPTKFGADELRSFYDPVTFFRLFEYETLFYFDFDNLQTIWKVSLLCAAFGILYPISSFFSFAIALWFAGIPLNFGKIHHSNHMIVTVLGILAFSFVPGRLALDNLIFKKVKRFYRVENIVGWPLLTIRIYMTLTYFGAGFQKLRHGGLEWIFSDNMATIILTRPTMTPLGEWVSQFHYFTIFLAFSTVLFQLTAPLSLFSRKWAAISMTTNFFMHIGTYLVLGNHGYFFAYNLCFAAWLPWEDITNFLRKKGFKFLGPGYQSSFNSLN